MLRDSIAIANQMSFYCSFNIPYIKNRYGTNEDFDNGTE